MSAYKMTANQLKSIRISMGMDIKSMAIMLGWPYRTYQDRELGNRGIPAKAVAEVYVVQERDRKLMLRIKNKIETIIDAQYPTGIKNNR